MKHSLIYGYQVTPLKTFDGYEVTPLKVLLQDNRQTLAYKKLKGSLIIISFLVLVLHF